MLTLHPITPAAAAAYKAVRLRALLDTPTAFGSTHAKEAQLSDDDWQRRAARLDGDRAVGYLAVDDQEPCGIAAGFLDSNDAGKAHLVSMWVAPTHRNRGVGRRLVDEAAGWARSRGARTLCLMVTSSNQAATAFYERLGFAKTGRTEPYPNDPALVEYEMSRSVENYGHAAAT
jgi:ribosomal protein S18 acetylase RimI-like enzyme